MKVFIEDFNSILDYAEVCDKRENNKAFGSCRESHSGNESFHGSKSWEESISLIKNGYNEGFDKIVKERAKTNYMGTAKKQMPFNDVVGFTPNVPNTLLGIPQSMINNRGVEHKQKVVSILHVMSVSARTSTDDIVKSGVNLINMVASLEAEGYRVGIYYSDSSYEDGELAISRVCVKHERQQSNLMKLAYPLVHPSMFRRQGFRFFETCRGLTSERFRHGYGKTLRAVEGFGSHGDMDNKLRELGILRQGWVLTTFDICLENSGEELMKKIGIK